MIKGQSVMMSSESLCYAVLCSRAAEQMCFMQNGNIKCSRGDSPSGIDVVAALHCADREI
jgi:hypothetical protein